MADIGMTAGGGETRRTSWVGVVLVSVTALAAWQLGGRPEHEQARDSANVQAIAHHCAQFVAIAKASFGANWKPRLDPRDPLCADAIQQAWERQRIPRAATMAPLPMPPAPAETVAEEPVELAPPAPADIAGAEASQAKRDTYCLNILGLARSHYGDNWESHLTMQEATDCAAHAQRMR